MWRGCYNVEMRTAVAGLCGGGVLGASNDSPSVSGLLTMAAVVVTLLLHVDDDDDGGIALRLERDDLWVGGDNEIWMSFNSSAG